MDGGQLSIMNLQYQKGKSEQAYIFFWKEDEENGWLSNWYKSKFVIDDFEYLHVEQYIMAQKAKLFHDSKRYTAILKSNKQWEVKALGREITPFDNTIWIAHRSKIAKVAIKAKFEQNKDLYKKLLATDNAILVEASPKDKIWGIGLDAETASHTDCKDWPGEGILGDILMEVREELRK